MAHEFDGKKYEKASAHQKEWGAKLIFELSLKGNERVAEKTPNCLSVSEFLGPSEANLRGT